MKNGYIWGDDVEDEEDEEEGDADDEEGVGGVDGKDLKGKVWRRSNFLQRTSTRARSGRRKGLVM
jgi:hypothetical protein